MTAGAHPHLDTELQRRGARLQRLAREARKQPLECELAAELQRVGVAALRTARRPSVSWSASTSRSSTVTRS